MKYGAKTRSGEAVSLSGQRNQGGTGTTKQAYEQQFLAPGTWTWPGNCSFVEVLVVSGGDSGLRAPAGFPIPTGQTASATSGNGGGVGRFTIEVSGPVPVTVGAGGAANPWPGPTPLRGPNLGGASAFGPTSPPIPTSGTAYAIPFGNNDNNSFQFGLNPAVNLKTELLVNGRLYGYGGASPDFSSARGAQVPAGRAAEAGRANTGEGGGGFATPTVVPWAPPVPPTNRPYLGAAAGGSGIVIVRWFE